MKGKFIVKVQTSIYTSQNTPQMLVYNQSQSVMLEQDLTMFVEGKMDGEKKKFFWARMVGEKVVLMEEAPWQHW